MKPKSYLFLIICILICSFDLSGSEIELSGDIGAAGLPVCAGLGSIIYEKDLEGAFQLSEAYLVQLTSVYALKFMINKRRPNGGDFSFPSAHTASAFTSAAFLHKRYGWKIGVPAYLAAGYVGWTRIKAKKHYPWDVFGGAVIGFGFGYFLPEKFNSDKMKLNINASEEYIGISYSYKF